MREDFPRLDPDQSIAALLGKGTLAGSLDKTPPSTEAPVPEGKASDPATYEKRAPRWKLDGVVLHRKTRSELDTFLSRVRNHKLIYEDWGLAEIDPRGLSVALNLYGLPGTGKTMCAEAIAHELGKELIEVNYAEIESKYVGETPKKICEVFRKAAESEALLFFDEADSILGARLTQVTQAADHGVNVSRAVMLKQMDAFTGIVVFATNLAKNFDGAFVRRILQHIELLPPDREGRLALWKRMLPSRVPGRDTLDWPLLSERAEGLVGGDLKNVAIIALSSVAERPSAERRLMMEDLDKAMEQVRKAKRDIGRYDYDVSAETVPLSEVAV